MSYQPRYIAYARAHGKSPEEMLEADGARFPGGKMAGFMIWIGQQWAQWYKETGYPKDHPLGMHEHAAFTRWLEESVEIHALEAEGMTTSDAQAVLGAEKENA